MIEVAICDDENSIVNQIEIMIHNIRNERNFLVTIDVFFSGTALDSAILKGAKYDLIYLDLQIEGEDGITVARNIRGRDENVSIVFVSGYDKYWLESLQLDVVTFLRKPIQQLEFEKIFLKAHQKICKQNYYFTFQYKGADYKIPCKEVIYFESSGRHIKIYIRSQEIVIFNGKLSDVMTKLIEGKIPFLRIHQSYLVNYYFIRTKSKSEVNLINGEKLPISEERQKDFARNYDKVLKDDQHVSF